MNISTRSVEHEIAAATGPQPQAPALALPSDWRWAKLGEFVTSYRNGLVRRPIGDEAGPIVLRIADVSSGAVNLATPRRIRMSPREMEDYSLQRGDLLFIRVNGGRELVGRCVLVDFNADDISFNDHLIRVRLTGVMPEYVRAYCDVQEVRRYLVGKTAPTAGQLTINQDTLANIAIRIPPLAEQRAIVRILRSVQDAIQARRRELELERERKAALMQHLFTFGAGGAGTPTKQTRFGEVPAHWCVQALVECAYVQTGIAKGRKLDGHHTIVRPYIRVANVQDGYLDLGEIKHIELLESEVDRYSLQPGDVLLTEGGDFDKLGRGFIWRNQVPGCVHQNHIFAVRADGAKLLGDFLAYLVQSPYGKGYFLSVAHRTTNLASINSTKLKALPSLVPPLDEQRAIVDALDACDAQIDVMERETALLEELFRALLEGLMTGRLSALPLVVAEAEQTGVEAEAGVTIADGAFTG